MHLFLLNGASHAISLMFVHLDEVIPEENLEDGNGSESEISDAAPRKRGKTGDMILPSSGRECNGPVITFQFGYCALTFDCFGVF